jgi:hypothetical protein
MADYILLNSADEVLEEADSTRFRKTGVPPKLKPAKGLRWLSLVVVDPQLGEGQIKEGPVVKITTKTYTRTWTVRDTTSAERSDEKTTHATGVFNSLKPLLLALNDGSFVPGSNYTEAQIKAKIKAKL